MPMFTTTSGHTVRAFDADLQLLNRMLAEMRGHAERQVTQAVDALNKGDRDSAGEVVTSDATLDLQQREIEQRASAWAITPPISLNRSITF
jgi:phosphate uptake regulator